MKLTVLVLDPEHATREDLRLTLKEDGHRVWAFSSATSAAGSLAEAGFPDLALLSAGEDPGLDTLVSRLRNPSTPTQIVWIAPPGDTQIERLVAKHHPRGLLPRTNLAAEARELARRVSRTQERSRVLHTVPEMLGESEAMLEVQTVLRKVAVGGAPTVLVTGESGTGKEVAARTLHLLGPRQDRPFVEVDCAAIPAGLMESELFGHERGTFTDAKEQKVGLLELGQGGTVFLDEIGEMEYGLQSKLLRVLDSRRLRRLGGSEEIELDVHLVAATNRNLESEVREGRFRADLYYRLDVVRVHMPPLRERGGDVVLLARRFLEEFTRRLGRAPLRFSPSAEAELGLYGWPGNVRELRNHVERLVLLAPGDQESLEAARIPAQSANDRSSRVRIDLTRGPVPWETIERVALTEALRLADGNVSEAARLLGLGRGAIRYRLSRHGLAGAESESDLEEAA